MDPTCNDLFIMSSRRAYYKNKKRLQKEQRSRKCHVCKKIFPSGNKLFKHLKENRKHCCDLDWITYELECKIHQEYKENCLSISHSHFIPVEDRNGVHTLCNNVFVKRIKINRFYRKEYCYYVEDFDQNDLKN